MSAFVNRRIRSIKPEWVGDRRLQKAGSDARVLSIAIITMSDDEGRGHWRERVVANEVFEMHPDPVATCRDAVATLLGWFLNLYEVDGETYWEVLKWGQHQRIDKPKPSRLPAPPKPPESLGSSASRETLDASATCPENLRPGSGSSGSGSGSGSVAPARVATTEPPVTRLRSVEAPIETARRLLVSGYQQRFEARTGQPWMSAASVGRAIDSVAVWCVAAAGAEPVEATVSKLLDGVFADETPRFVNERWPLRWVAEDPGKWTAPPTVRERRGSLPVATREQLLADALDEEIR